MFLESKDKEFSISKLNIARLDFLRRIDFSYEEGKIIFDYSDLSIDDFSMNMQLENDIEGLVKLECVDKKANVFIYSCNNLKEIDFDKMDLTLLKDYLLSILSLKKSLKKYLLSPEKCLWTSFLSFDKNAKLQVINLPILEGKEYQSIGAYIREILSKTSFKDYKEIQTIGKYYKLANMGFDESNYTSIFENSDQNKWSGIENTRVLEDTGVHENCDDKQKKKIELLSRKIGINENYRLLKDSLDKIIKKIFDKKEKKIANKLFDKEGNEIKLDKYIYLGADSDRADILIKGQGIAPIHTIVMKRENTIYVEDNNTLEGTFVNNRRITSNTLISLKDGDALGLGLVKDFLFARYVDKDT